MKNGGLVAVSWPKRGGLEAVVCEWVAFVSLTAMIYLKMASNTEAFGGVDCWEENEEITIAMNWFSPRRCSADASLRRGGRWAGLEKNSERASVVLGTRRPCNPERTDSSQQIQR